MVFYTLLIIRVRAREGSHVKGALAFTAGRLGIVVVWKGFWAVWQNFRAVWLDFQAVWQVIVVAD